jgi:serine/threonine-protein kinase
VNRVASEELPPASLIETLHEGDILVEKFRIERFLGRGAMGFVVRATDLALERQVAIKFLLRTAEGELERRFLREARIAAKLKSQHAVKVIDVGIHQGAPFIAMEYLEGEDLAAHLKRLGPLSIDLAITYILQACEALAEAHGAGIVHRDIKPANLMLTTGPGGAACVKVLDFGVSKVIGPTGLAGTEEVQLTSTSQAIGSPLYMAPEQINDAANVDGRADIWSIGVTLYQFLTETTPWTGTTVMALLSAMATKPATPIVEYRPDVPPGLAAVIEQCLEKDRSRRWSSVAEFAAALGPYTPATMMGYAARIGGALRTEVAPSRPTVQLESPSPVVRTAIALTASTDRGREAGATRGMRVTTALGLVLGASALAGIGAHILRRESLPPSVAATSASSAPEKGPRVVAASDPPSSSAPSSSAASSDASARVEPAPTVSAAVPTAVPTTTPPPKRTPAPVTKPLPAKVKSIYDD